MFNRKKIKELELLLKEEKTRNDSLMSKLNRIDISLSRNVKDILDIGQKISPNPIAKYDASAIELAKKLQSYPKKQQCGMGKCQLFYQIPVIDIDSIANGVS